MPQAAAKRPGQKKVANSPRRPVRGAGRLYFSGEFTLWVRGEASECWDQP
jgi:hypothetical protein